jgi:hypothetical protein
MIPAQTTQVLFGFVMAIAYAGVVLAAGVPLLSMILGKQGRATVYGHLGSLGVIWFGFVLGQGVLGVVWLFFALTGIFYASLLWIVCSLGWALGCVQLFVARDWVNQEVNWLWAHLRQISQSRSWYMVIGVGIGLLGLLRGVIALLPPSADDALSVYLVVPRMIAATEKLQFQPFVTPPNGLFPIQVEIHFAVLFALANETAVTMWDYLCSVSSLCGVGLLAWSFTASRRVTVVAVLMMLSTLAFSELMGGGKPDNTAAQYGIAAFLWMTLWPIEGTRAAMLTGLCLGWAMASRYTNVILLPAVAFFAVLKVYGPWRVFTLDRPGRKFWIMNGLACGIAAICAGGPMLVKNMLLVGCPLAPVFGCQGTFWTAELKAIQSNIQISNLQYLPLVKILSSPFSLTFSHRNHMIGNISPLFLGFSPFLLMYWRVPLVRSALIAGFTGLISVGTWWVIVNDWLPYPRWILVPLGLFAVSLSAAAVTADNDCRSERLIRWLIRSAMLFMLFLLLFQSRAVVYGIRYLSVIDGRGATYREHAYYSYDVAMWLNAQVQPGQRVGADNWVHCSYFVDPHILLNSETTEERQWLWERRHLLSRLDWWTFYRQHRFSYLIVPKNEVESIVAALPKESGLEVAFVGRHETVLKIAEQ